jgi:hypothetical protein
MARASLQLLALLLCAAAPASCAPWRPTPPCAAPAGIARPAVAECMCSREAARRGDVAVREVGLPAAATLVVSAFSAPQWDVVIGYGVTSLLDFFAGDNARKAQLPGARTAPISFRQRALPNGTVTQWTSGMLVSTAAFPAPASIPAPVDPLALEAVGHRLVAVRQFDTPGRFPTQAEFAAACAGISADSLPSGYAINTTSEWTPTYLLYSAESSPVYESECWVEVTAI